MPMDLENDDSKVTVTKIDFNVRSTTKSEVPENIMRRKIFCLKNPVL